MSRNVFAGIVVLLITVFCAAPAHSQFKKLAQAGMTWMNIPVGARALGMGDAFMAVSDGSMAAAFKNPSALAFIDQGDFFAGRSEWLADISQVYVGGAYNFGMYGIVGLSAVVMNFGDFMGTRLVPGGFEDTGTFSPDGYAISLVYGYRQTDRFAFGGRVSYVKQDLGSAYVGDDINTLSSTGVGDMNTWAFDIGVTYFFGYQDLRIAMGVQNFSREQQYFSQRFPLPLTFRIGTAMDLLQAMAEGTRQSLLVSVEAIHPRDYTERLHVGGEYGFRDLLFLRAGYKFNYDEEGATYGAGVKVPFGEYSLQFDYALNPFGIFDNVSKIDVTISF